MKWIIACSVALALSACGVDGEPIKPSVSNTVTLNNNGVNVGTRIGARVGPVNIGFSL